MLLLEEFMLIKTKDRDCVEFQYGLRSKSGKWNLAITIHQFLQDLATISH